MGKQITSATAYFWNWYSPSCTAREWQVWTVGAIANGVVWSTQPTWDHLESTSSATAGFDTTCNDNWVSGSATAFFQRAADAGDSAADMGLRAVNETDVQFFKQLRSQLGGNVPYAVVNYNSYPQVTARATDPTTPCVTGAARPQLATLTPTLRATVSDAEGTAMSVTFEWWTLTGGAPLGSATVSGVASGATASTVIPGGALSLSDAYRWRVRVSDGTGTTTSSYCEFTLYEVAPPAVGCTGGTDADFNGDGVRDVAIADPDATAVGLSKAGLIHIVDGASAAVTTLSQDLAEVPDVAESSAGFGYALAVADLNVDGCSDLVVGAPFKNLDATNTDTGAVYLLLGSPQGLAKGPASLTFQQGLNGTPETPEGGDNFGYSVAAGRTAGGKSYLVIGAPGENLPSTDTGTAHYLFGDGGVNVLLNQDTASVPSLPETDDKVGYSVTASPYHIAVGAPGEAVGTSEFSGLVHVFRHTLTSGVPTYLADLQQNETGVSDSADPNDQFGHSISMAPFRPTGAPVGQPNSLLVVGVPGEDFSSGDDGGMVQRFHLTATGFTELPAVSQGTDVLSGIESGDYFGHQVVVVNTNPNAEASASTLLVAVGSPGEDVGEVADAGTVHVFGAAASPIAVAALAERGSSLPGTPRLTELIGLSIGASQADLYVGAPQGSPAMVYAIPWSSLAAGTATPTRSWQPGVAGIPSAGNISFGAIAG